MNQSEGPTLSMAEMRMAGVPAEVVRDILSESGRTRADLHRALGRHVSPAFIAPLLYSLSQGKAEALDGATIIEDIATGGSGHVLVGWEWSLGRVVAKKLVSAEEITARREFKALLRIDERCPGIAPAPLAIDDEDRILTTEYCDGTDLSHLASAGFRRRVAFTVAALAKSASHLHALHEHVRLAHRDVKPSNLLWDMAKQSLYVADFGNSRKMKNGNIVETETGAVTMMYCAPEDLKDDLLIDGRSADVFALGMTGYALGTGEVPYGDEVTSAGIAVAKGIDGVPDHIERVREELGPVLGAFLGRMMASMPDQRPTMASCAGVLSAWDRELNARLYGKDNDPSRLRFPVASGADPLQPYRRENHMRINPASVIEALDDMYPEFQRNTTYVLPDPK